MESEYKPQHSYEYYLYTAQSLAAEGKYDYANEIIEFMLQNWPERLISRSRKLTKTHIFNEKLKV